jgi:predicted metalloprotease
MTFNEGMQIDTSNISAGGRGPGRGIAIGGGLGGLVIVVIALLLGVDPSTVVPQQEQIGTGGVEAPGYDLSHCKTGADANKYVECRVVATTNSVDGVWQQLLPGYTPPHTTLFHGQVQTGCGPATSDVGPFYCPVDKTAYFDTDFFQVLVDQFGSSGGPLAQEYVVAHEYGHHVQDLTGIESAVQSRQGADSDSVRLELQADCFAGVWANHATTVPDPQTGEVLITEVTQDDINRALDTAARIGDDYIQKNLGGGQVDQNTFTHGSSQQREKWFTTGYQTGDANQCDTFETSNLG